MTLRCFFSMEVIWPVRPGGGIFSNVKAGMPSPLFVELEHSLGISLFRSNVKNAAIGLTRLALFRHNLCQNS